MPISPVSLGVDFRYDCLCDRRLPEAAMALLTNDSQAHLDFHRQESTISSARAGPSTNGKFAVISRFFYRHAL